MTYTKPTNPHPVLAPVVAGNQLVDVLAYVNDGFVIDDRHLLAGRPDLVTVRLLPEARTQPVIRPRMFILHTQGGSRRATNEQARSFAENYSNLEAHGYGPQMDDGKLLQAMPFDRRADSSAAANSFRLLPDRTLWGALTLETQDNGNATLRTTPWTNEQVSTIVGTITACCVVYRIRCTVCTWDLDSGVAHHSLFPSWSRSGHDCPGNARIRQMDWIRGAVTQRVADYYANTGGTCP